MNTRQLMCAIVAFTMMGGACVPAQSNRTSLNSLVSERIGSGASLPSVRSHDDDELSSDVRALLAHPIDGPAAVRIALANNRSFRQGVAELGIAAADVIAASALPNPNVGFSYQLPIGTANASRPALVDFDALIDVQSLILLGARRGSATEELEATRLEVASRAVDLAFEAEVRLYRYVASEQIVESEHDVLLATGAAFETARALDAAGTITELDRSQQEALYQDARLSLNDAESEARQSREGVNEVLGLWGDGSSWHALARLADPPVDDTTPANAEVRAVERSLELVALQHRVAAARGRVGLARASTWIPTIEAGVAAAVHEGITYVGPAVRVGLPVFYQGEGAIESRSAELQSEQARYEAAAVTVRASARAAVQRLEAARMRARFYRDVQLPLRARIVDQTQRQLNAMQVNLFVLIQARRDQIDTGRGYIEALRDYWIARAEVARILAGGSPTMTSESTMRLDSHERAFEVRR